MRKGTIETSVLLPRYCTLGLAPKRLWGRPGWNAALLVLLFALCGAGVSCSSGAEQTGGDCEAGEPGCDFPDCVPACEGRECGDDGCGGSCGSCDDDERCEGEGVCAAATASCGDGRCSEAQEEDCASCPADCACAAGLACNLNGGFCQCLPDCTMRECGPDGCGGSCGSCDDDELCGGDGQCAAAPASCGLRGCEVGEDCASCPEDCGECCGDGRCDEAHDEDCASCPEDCGCLPGQACEASTGICECLPACEGRACGPDGCGGSCGECEDDDRCDAAGACVPPPENCGNGSCSADEDCRTCPADCGSCCGDGACVAAHDEDCATCIADCGCQGSESCDVASRRCVCEPACSGRECGPDGCGGACGSCDAGEECSADGRCEVDCVGDCGALWSASCTSDDFGFRMCVPQANDPTCTEPSRRIPCGPGRVCAGGSCRGECLKPEVLVLVDRSSSMSSAGRWQFTEQALQQLAAERRRTVRLGLRHFPAAGCNAGSITSPDFDNSPSFHRLPAPEQDASTPIRAAFEGIEPAFGDPDEGESIILITDGDETCAGETDVVERVRELRRRGLRTFAVGISRQSNGELLSQIAEAGGTARAAGTPHYLVENGAELSAALEDILGRLDTCACEELETRCDGDRLEQCHPDGYDFALVEDCALGCSDEAQACHSVCRPGSVRCAGEVSEVCSADGAGFSATATCAFGCAAGVGCRTECRPGTHRCDGLDLQRCRADGSGFDAVMRCSASCNDGSGECGSCVPGDRRCNGLVELEECNAAGTAFEAIRSCGRVGATRFNSCAPTLGRCAGEPGSVRLMDGPNARSGRVELEPLASSFSPICRDFGLAEGGVVCRQLGYPAVVAVHFDSPFGELDEPGLRYDCDGDEYGLEQCARLADGGRCPGRQMGVECASLQSGHRFCDGRASVLLVGGGVVRRTECPSVCTPSTGQCRTVCTAGEHGCHGNSLSTCWDDGLGRSVTPCGAMQCSASSGSCIPNPNDPEEGTLRLVDGASPSEGRLELFLNGEWGTVCHRDFDDAELDVACRQMGFEGGERVEGSAFYGEGTGPIHLDRLECAGDESRLIDCSQGTPFGWGDNSDCTHASDVGIVCFGWLPVSTSPSPP